MLEYQHENLSASKFFSGSRRQNPFMPFGVLADPWALFAVGHTFGSLFQGALQRGAGECVCHCNFDGGPDASVIGLLKEQLARCGPSQLAPVRDGLPQIVCFAAGILVGLLFAACFAAGLSARRTPPGEPSGPQTRREERAPAAQAPGGTLEVVQADELDASFASPAALGRTRRPPRALIG